MCFLIGFGIELNVPQIAFRIGNFAIYYYAICIVLGIVISLILGYFDKEKFNIKFDDIIEIFTFSLITGIIGARAYYCLFNLSFYLNNPSKIFAIRDGGLAIYGGIIFGIITAFILSRMKKINFADLMDYIAPYLVLTQGIGRLGNFFNKEAYGVETKNIFRMGIMKNGNIIEVHPCFLYEFIACIIIFFVLKILKKKRKFEFQIFSTYMIMYGIVRFFIESIRIDSLYFRNIKISQAVSIVFVIVGTFIHIYQYQKKSNFVNRNM